MFREGVHVLRRRLSPRLVHPVQHVQCLTLLLSGIWLRISAVRTTGGIAAMSWLCCMAVHAWRRAVRLASCRLLQPGLPCLRMWRTRVVWRSHVLPLWCAARRIFASPSHDDGRLSSVGVSGWTVHWDWIPSRRRMTVVTGRPRTLVPECQHGLHRLW